MSDCKLDATLDRIDVALDNIGIALDELRAEHVDNHVADKAELAEQRAADKKERARETRKMLATIGGGFVTLLTAIYYIVVILNA